MEYNKLPPLHLYLIWHPKLGADYFNGLGKRYRDFFYSKFCRNIHEPLSRSPGIPVFFRSEFLPGENVPRPIDLSLAFHTVVVVLVDANVLLNAEWAIYIDKLIHQVKNSNERHLIIPVAIESKAAYGLSTAIGKFNFIRLYEKGKLHEISDIRENSESRESVLQSQLRFLLRNLLEQLCSIMIYHSEDVSASPTMSLFLSHSKHDADQQGVMVAKTIIDYIKSKSTLRTFFDKLNIRTGRQVQKEIERVIKSSALIAIQTDSFSSREFCRLEVLLAKRNFRPIVVVDAVGHSVDRSFPYMWNVPCIRWQNDQIPVILELILFEILCQLYNKHLMDYYLTTFPYPPAIPIPVQPELLHFSYFNETCKQDEIDYKYILYPSPPLGEVELDILKSEALGFEFLTPPYFAANSLEAARTKIQGLPLKGMRIGLSISETMGMEDADVSFLHLRDAMVELSRFLLSSGATLCYGGDVRYKKEFNLISILYDHVERHNTTGFYEHEKIFNYLAYPLIHTLNNQEKSEMAPFVKLIAVEPVDDLPDQKAPLALLAKDKGLREQYWFARCLTKMRLEMNTDIHARIIVGGKLFGYQGRYPGVAEEANLAYATGKPLFLLGGFGGCGDALVRALQGEIVEAFTLEKQREYSPAYRDFVSFFNSQKDSFEGGVSDRIDYDNFRSGLKGKLNNGLSDQENALLFKSEETHQMIALILKGLIRISKN